jgi:hypothetical protein
LVLIIASSTGAQSAPFYARYLHAVEDILLASFFVGFDRSLPVPEAGLVSPVTGAERLPRATLSLKPFYQLLPMLPLRFVSRH